MVSYFYFKLHKKKLVTMVNYKNKTKLNNKTSPID